MERIEWVHNIVESLRDRIKTVVEMVEASEYFYIAPTGYDQKGEMKYFSKPGIDDLLEKGAGVLSQIDEWSLESCEKAYRN